MTWRIVITEFTPAQQSDAAVPNVIERYSQSVDRIDLQKIIDAVNAKPPRVRVRKQKAQA